MVRVHLVLGGWLFCVVPLYGQLSYEEVTKIGPHDAASNDRFGHWVDIDGDVIIVGSAFDDVGAEEDAGSAYVFERNQGGTDAWGQVTPLLDADGETWDQFGSCVAISGDVAVVGARFTDNDDGDETGAVFVYYRDEGGADNWGLVTRIIGSDSNDDDEFGLEVDISGDWIVVGAAQNDEEGTEAGAAYVYHRDEGGKDNWGEFAKLTAKDADAGDRFGSSVSLSGDTLVASARRDAEVKFQGGAAYVFELNAARDAWEEVQKLIPSDVMKGDAFGYCAAIDGDVVVVGGFYSEDFYGSAYLFERDEGGTDNWGEVLELTASEGSPFDGFAQSIDIRGDVVIIGARSTYDDQGGEAMGVAYVFERDEGGTDNWGESQILSASDAAASSYFGNGVAATDTLFVISSLLGNFGGTDSGAAYVFARSEPHFIRGDVNGDGTVSNLLDPVVLLRWGFLAASAPPCIDAADVDDNGAAQPLVDAVHLLRYAFIGGTPPPTPYSGCGIDPTEDDVSCDTSTCAP